VTGFRENNVGATARLAAGVAVLLWIAQLLGLPVNVRPFLYVIVGFAALYAGAYLIDTVWLAIKGRGATRDEPEA